MEERMVKKFIGGEINKVAEDGEERIVGGIFTDDLVDYAGHMIDRLAMIEAVAEYRKWGNIRDMHDRVVGVAKSVGEKAWNYLEAKIIPDDAWKLVKEGAYKGFSVGIIVTDGEFVDVKEIPDEKFMGLPDTIVKAIKDFGEVFMITGLELIEVSIVDRPANPRARFDAAVKGMGGAGELPSVFEGAVELRKMFGHGNQVIVEESKVENQEIAEVVHEDVAEEQPVEKEIEPEVEAEIEPEVEAAVEPEVEAAVEPEVEAEAEVGEEPVQQNFDAEKLIDDVSEVIAPVVDAVSELKDLVADLVERISELEKARSAERLGVVNHGEPEEEEKPLNVKALGTSELTRIIAKKAVERVNK